MSAFLSLPQRLKEHINTLHCCFIENEIQWWQVDSRLIHLLTPTTECFVFTTPICRLWSRMSYSGWQSIGIKRFIQFSPKYVHGFVARFLLWSYNEFVAISCGAQCGTFITRLNFSRIFTMTPRYSPVSARYAVSFHDDVIKWKHFPRYWPLCGEFTGHRWILRTKASDAELCGFLWSAP